MKENRNIERGARMKAYTITFNLDDSLSAQDAEILIGKIAGRAVLTHNVYTDQKNIIDYKIEKI